VAFWLRGERLPALLLLPLAISGHALPVVWGVGVVIFLAVAKAFPRIAFAGALAIVCAVSFIIHAQPYSFWTILQIENTAGFDQLDVFEPKYVAMVLAMLVLWGILFWRQTQQRGSRAMLFNPTTQLLALLSLSMAIIPLSMKVPGKLVLLGYIPNRLSVTVALLALGLAGQVPAPRWAMPAFSICLLCFWTLLYRDTGDYNRLEERLAAALEHGARGQRVVLAARPISRRTNLEVNVMTHMIDRACLGRCYSYANYEPSTEVFRLRATGPNPFVTASYEESISMQAGKYVVTEADLPLLQANVFGIDQPIWITVLHAGQLAGVPACGEVASKPGRM
jgi:hypothetical protein